MNFFFIYICLCINLFKLLRVFKLVCYDMRVLIILEIEIIKY